MIELLKQITNEIGKLQIPYMLSGSLAMGFYTIQRTTKDIDLVIELNRGDVEKLVEAFQDSFYCYAPSIEEAIRYNSMFNFIDNDTGIKVDFILRKNSEYDFLAFERKQSLSLEEGDEAQFWVISLEDLIIAKLRWIQELQSERQIEDIHQLLLNPDLDRSYLLTWIQQLQLKTFSIDFNI